MIFILVSKDTRGHHWQRRFALGGTFVFKPLQAANSSTKINVTLFEGHRPATIMLHPATKDVAKLTFDVPREKVLSGADRKEPANAGQIGAMRVRADAIIATAAETVLYESHPVQMGDDRGARVDILNRKTILHVLFGAGGATGLAG